MKPIAPDLVSLIEKHDPARMALIRAAYPDQQKALSSARELGDTAQTGPLTERERLVHLDLLRSGIPTAISRIETLGRDLRRRMDLVSNIRFWGTVCAAVSGGLGTILALVMRQDYVNAATALMAMISALAALFADHFDRAPSGVRVKTTEEFNRILEYRGEIEAIRIKIERDDILPSKDDDIRAMLKNMDETSRRVSYLSAI